MSVSFIAPQGFPSVNSTGRVHRTTKWSKIFPALVVLKDRGNIRDSIRSRLHVNFHVGKTKLRALSRAHGDWKLWKQIVLRLP